MKKRILSILLTVCMVLSLLPTVALAASDPNTNTFDISEGNITIINGTTSGTIKVTYGASQSKDNINAETILITGTTTSNKVIVNTTSDITVKIKLDNVGIQLANDCAFDIQNASVVEMTLAGTNILKSGVKDESATYKGYAGLQVENGSSGTAKVTIGGNGSLEAMGGDNAAGIGGRAGWQKKSVDYGTSTDAANCGKVTIISGTVKATASLNGAGIGGGGASAIDKKGGNGGEITITGGTVIATGGDWRGAGIGGGGAIKGGAGGIIIITGGNVTAIGGGNAAGIGGSGLGTGDSYAGAAGSIKISNAAKVAAASSGTKPSIEDDDGNIAPDSGTAANILEANYQSNVTGNANTEVKDASSNALSPVVSFTPQRAYKSIAFTMPMASYTLYTGAAKQMGTISGTTSTTFTVAAGLNVFTDVTASTYTGKVTVKKDDSTWTADTPTIKMSTSSSTLTGAVSGALLNGEYTFNGLADGNTYYAWEDGTTDTYTGRSVTIDSKSATVNYYTLALVAGAGTTSPTGNGVYLQGKSVAIDATVNTGYAWSKWTSSNTTLLPDQTTKSVGITIPAGPIILTATAETTAYSIAYQLNGGTVSVANPSSYTVESAAITLNTPARSGYSFLGWSGTGLTGSYNQTVTIPTGSTENKTYTANWKADKPSAPDASIVTAKTDTSLTITTLSGYEYSVGGTNWYSGTGSYTFTSLSPNTAYNLVCRKAAVSMGDISSASDVSEALSVTTKKASASISIPAAPTIGTGADKPTSDRITISTAAGNEYYISTSNTAPATWPSSGSDYFKATGTDGHTFTGLTAGTQYYIHVRVAETENGMPSASAYTAQYTLPETPAASAVSINYAAETINFDNTYEISTDVGFSTTTPSGVTLQPGMTYYVRVKAAGGVPASEPASFTVSARPDAPSADLADGAYSYDYEDEQIVFGTAYEVYTATSGGSALTSNSTAITPGSTLYIRVKATSSAPASEWTTITVPTRRGTTGLSIYTISSDTTITVTAITGAEYSNDGGAKWQSSNKFTALDADRDYDITIRYAADSAFASDALTSVTVRTKTSAGGAPSDPPVSEQTDHAITINTVEGYQYAINTSDTEPTSWGAAETTTGTKTFSSLSAATRYYIWVRVAETPTAMPSNSNHKSVYTTASVPSAEGYSIDYNAETISYDGGIYEVTADTVAFPLIIGDGDSITDNISDYGAAAQKIYVRVKAVKDGAPAGAWMAVTLPARPVTPSAIASNETAENKNDGRISGVTEAMEWRAAGGAYTVVTAEQALNGITGLSDGTYYVRYMAVSGTGFKSDEQVITIGAGDTITVNFNAQSGSAVDPITGKAYGDSITAPADPLRSGFYFAGWYKDASCTNPWTFTLDTLTGHITLFAKWSAIPTYTVTGSIVDDTSHMVEGATVRMMQGATQFGATGITDSNGDFTIDKVPPGIYNLVITKGAKTAIVKVEVSSGNVAIGNATLPSGNANSILVVNGNDTPNVVVGGLDSEARAQLAGSSNVEVKLTVEEKNAAAAANGSEVTGAASAAGKQVGIILAIDVRKTVNGTEDTSYNQTSEMIEINIPLPAELQGKATYAIYRYHGAGVDTITESPNGDQERIAIDRTKWTITLYAKKFSTYAIGYTNPASGGGGHTAAAGAAAAAIESQKAGALPYYVENGKEVFIGLSKDASGTMRYIAPEGVTVLFRENPKDFSDITGHWAKDNIDFVTERELFLGTGDDKFSPQSGMTRAMFATVIGRLYERSYGELLQNEDNNFTDVDSDAYYEAYISWASANNIITGIGGGLFKPDREITRQEMAAILCRFAEFLNVLPSDLERTQLNYPDAAGISSWATEAAGYCQQTGIITGRLGGNFVPQGTATRAEVAAILQRFIESSVK